MKPMELCGAMCLIIMAACTMYAMMDFGVFVLSVFFTAAGCPS